MRPWIPLLITVPLSVAPWIPGLGVVAALYVPLGLWVLSLLSPLFQGKGARLKALVALLAGYALPVATLATQLPIESPGPGEGLLVVFYVHAMALLGTALTTLVGWMARRRGV